MSTAATENLLEQVKFDDKGLVGAIVQDAATNEVLMFAWMNREALEKTLTEGRACYWSRSRKKLWVKGESSGNTQTVKSIRLDCDGDALLLAVEQTGGACHTGHRTPATALAFIAWPKLTDGVRTVIRCLMPTPFTGRTLRSSPVFCWHKSSVVCFSLF